MQFVNEYTTSRKYVPNDPMVATVRGVRLRLFGELWTACELDAEQFEGMPRVPIQTGGRVSRR